MYNKFTCPSILYIDLVNKYINLKCESFEIVHKVFMLKMITVTMICY